MTKLAELRARVDALTGEDRDVDLALALALGLVPTGKEWKQTAPATWHKNLRLDWNGTRFDDCFQPAAYTASLDAAIALVEKVLPDTDYLGVFCDAGSWFAKIGIHDPSAASEWTYYKSNDGAAMDTPALALLSAMLAALENTEKLRREDEGNPEAEGRQVLSELKLKDQAQ
jgi:hypothetical protein